MTSPTINAKHNKPYQYGFYKHILYAEAVEKAVMIKKVRVNVLKRSARKYSYVLRFVISRM